ncbi:MAG: hypothetical protein Q9M91_05530 [Candidatus Dojkabacteria bacterium]|nr:hypothetical protein [Candidatus Dojkabacteria bacterium]
MHNCAGPRVNHLTSEWSRPCFENQIVIDPEVKGEQYEVYEVVDELCNRELEENRRATKRIFIRGIDNLDYLLGLEAAFNTKFVEGVIEVDTNDYGDTLYQVYIGINSDQREPDSAELLESENNVVNAYFRDEYERTTNITTFERKERIPDVDLSYS